MQENIHLSGTNACMCPELKFFLGKKKKALPMQKNYVMYNSKNLIGYTNKAKQVFITKIYFYPNLKPFKKKIVNFYQFFMSNLCKNHKIVSSCKTSSETNFTLCNKLDLRSEGIWHIYHKIKTFLIFNFFKFLPWCVRLMHTKLAS